MDTENIRADDSGDVVQIHVIEETEEVSITSENQVAAEMTVPDSDSDDADGDYIDDLIADCVSDYNLQSLEEYRTLAS